MVFDHSQVGRYGISKNQKSLFVKLDSWKVSQMVQKKLSEPWQFKKLKHLIGAKELFHVKLKNSVKSQCGNLMILHSISHISCEITFINAKSFHAFVH